MATAITFDSNNLVKVDVEDWKGGAVVAVSEAARRMPLVALDLSELTFSLLGANFLTDACKVFRRPAFLVPWPEGAT
jgi:hypothetical protein